MGQTCMAKSNMIVPAGRVRVAITNSNQNTVRDATIPPNPPTTTRRTTTGAANMAASNAHAPAQKDVADG